MREKSACFFKIPSDPVLLFLGFLDFLGKFEARNFLGYFGVFSVFPRILRVRQGQKILGNCRVFLDINQKAKEKKDRDGFSRKFRNGFKVFQQFPRVTSIGSPPPKALGKSRGPPQNPAEPSERPPQSPRRAL